MPNFDAFTVVDPAYLKDEHLSDAAIVALQAAEAEGLRTGAPALDGRLLLVGLMADERNLAAETMRHLAETPARMRAAAEALGQQTAGSTPSISGAPLPVAEEVRQLCRVAVDEALRLRPTKLIGPEHLLLALARDEENSAHSLLQQARVTLDRARRAVRIVLDMPAS